MGIEVHVSGRGCRSLFAIVDEAGGAVGHADEHESAATEIARLRMNDGERKACSHGRVHGIAARLHHLHPSPGSELMDAGHHRTRRVHRTHGRGGCGTRQREHYKERNQQVAMGSHELEMAGTAV